jgi:hypothetical protein
MRFFKKRGVRGETLHNYRDQSGAGQSLEPMGAGIALGNP